VGTTTCPARPWHAHGTPCKQGCVQIASIDWRPPDVRHQQRSGSRAQPGTCLFAQMSACCIQKRERLLCWPLRRQEFRETSPDGRHAVAQVPQLQRGAHVVIRSHHQLGGHLRVPLDRAAPLAPAAVNRSGVHVRAGMGTRVGGGLACSQHLIRESSDATTAMQALP